MSQPAWIDRPAFGVVATLALAAAAYWAWVHLDLSLADLRWGFLLASAALVPVSVTLTTMEYRLIAHASTVSVTFKEAVMVTVFGALANLLPVPGAAAVRLNDLIARDSGVRKAVGATSAMGMLWLGWSLIVSGSALFLHGVVLIGTLLVLAGIVSAVGSYLLLRAQKGFANRWWILRGSAIQLGSLAIGMLRLWLLILALDITASILQAAALVASGALASTAGLIPGGIGIREGIAAIFASLVAITPATAVLVVLMSRILGLLVQSAIALAAVIKRTTGRSPGHVSEDDLHHR